ncbi:MAG: biotin-dependent carboxyltransferase family protein [Desulfovermiculus sp.]
MAESFLVIEPGSLTTVQDLGRFGWQSLGVPVSGVMDHYAARAANLLVGNEHSAAVLEMTVTGMTLAVLQPSCLAVTGAKAKIKVNTQILPCWESFHVHPGDLVHIGQVQSGCRMYLAVSGGIDVPLVMGSRSTSAGTGLGGFCGRALQKGDILSAGPFRGLPHPARVPDAYISEPGKKIILRCVPGPQDTFFPRLDSSLFESDYTVTARSDRRGVRLEGPAIQHAHDSPGRVLSEPSLPGNIQIPGDGQPIVLLLEQTVGGYAKAATVISSDLPRLAQAVPGTSVRFEAISLVQAHILLSEAQQFITNLEKCLRPAHAP